MDPFEQKRNNEDPIDVLVHRVRDRLDDDGPNVDLALIDDYIDKVLEPNDHAEVEKRVRTWRNWHDAYWEARAFTYCDLDDPTKVRSSDPRVESPREPSGQKPRSVRGEWKWRLAWGITVAVSALLVASIIFSFWHRASEVAYIDDGYGRLEADRTGVVVGLENYPEQWSDQIKKVVQTERMPFPDERLTFFKGTRGTRSVYIRPCGTVVTGTAPTFEWKSAGKDLAYKVEVLRGAQIVDSSSVTKELQWRCGQELARGAVYSWRVVVIVDEGEELIDEPDARFKVLTQDELDQLHAMTTQAGESRLVMALMYLRFGLLDNAEHELALLATSNQESDLATDVLKNFRKQRGR